MSWMPLRLKIFKIALNQVIWCGTQPFGEVERMKASRLGRFIHSRKGSCLRSELPCNKINECDSGIMAFSHCILGHQPLLIHFVSRG